jgi:4-amino-4-deoxy-L-arabinose transferase-like glycosyltransferase
MQETLTGISRRSMGWELFVLVLAVVLMGSHWLHLTADPAVRMGWLGPVDWSGDLYTDEGWAASGAAAAVLRGHWHMPGDFNLAVDAPLWPALLYLPFKVFGVRIALARGIACGLYAGTVALLWSFVRRGVGRSAASVIALLLAANFLAMNFTRLAIVESAWIFFVVLALVIAQRGAGARPAWPAWVAGLVLGLAVLAKLTALCGLVPLLLVLYRESAGLREFVRRAALACGGLAMVFLPYRAWALRRFAEDHRLYTKINLSNAAADGLLGGVRAFEVVLRLAARLDVALAVCVCLGLVWAVVRRLKRHERGEKPMNVVTMACVGWLAANVALCSMRAYFPPRYCVSLVIPATVLAVVWTMEVMPRWQGMGLWMAGLLGVSFAANLAGTLTYEAHPVYSFQAMAAQIEQQAKLAGTAEPGVMGTFAHTISLYTALPAVNDDLGTVDRLQRIRRNHPRYYVAAGPASSEVARDFTLAGGELNLQQRFDVLQNYASHQPVYVYAVQWKPAATEARAGLAPHDDSRCPDRQWDGPASRQSY